MKIIAAFAFLALAYANPYSEKVKVAPPLPAVQTGDDSVRIVEAPEPNYKDILAANPPFDPNVPILRSNVAEAPAANAIDEDAPQYQSPIDIGMLFVPEEVIRAVAAADARNAEPVPLFPSLISESEDNLAVKFVESPMELEQVQKAEAPEEIVQPVVLAEPAVPYVASENVAFNLPMEPVQIVRIVPSELDAVIVEAPRVMPIQMQIPAMPEAEDNLAVKFVDSPMDQPEEYVKRYGDPMLR